MCIRDRQRCLDFAIKEDPEQWRPLFTLTWSSLDNEALFILYVSVNKCNYLCRLLKIHIKHCLAQCILPNCLSGLLCTGFKLKSFFFPKKLSWILKIILNFRNRMPSQLCNTNGRLQQNKAKPHFVTSVETFWSRSFRRSAPSQEGKLYPPMCQPLRLRSSNLPPLDDSSWVLSRCVCMLRLVINIGATSTAHRRDIDIERSRWKSSIDRPVGNLQVRAEMVL